MSTPSPEALVLVAALSAGYLCGSIPFGLLLLRAAGGPDPRTVGSGNIGATNVARAGGKLVGLMTLLLDAGKAFLPAWFFSRWGATPAALAGLLAVVGHCCPVWLKGRGGKGVASLLGAALALAWPAAVAFGVTWAAVGAATRLASIASVASCWVAAVAALVLPGSMKPESGIVLLLASALVTWRHRPNFRRLRLGEEPRMGARHAEGGA